jgi:hypothetical protein
MIAPNPHLFRYFLWEYRYWFMPTFLVTQVGRKNKGYLYTHTEKFNIMVSQGVTLCSLKDMYHLFLQGGIRGSVFLSITGT